LPRFSLLVVPFSLVIACSGDDHGASTVGDGTTDAAIRDSGSSGARGGSTNTDDAAHGGPRGLGGTSGVRDAGKQRSGGGDGGAGARGGLAPRDAGGTRDASDASGVPAADAGTPGASLGAFMLTYYWVTSEVDFSGALDTPLYDRSCAVLATVSSAFARALGVEGTGRLADGRVVNVDGACTCASPTCYVEVDAAHPFGYGVGGRALVPFRSIAVDKSVIAYGSHLYIPELDGVTMPSGPGHTGFVHDGCVSADDTGGGIIGRHVDFFSAEKAAYLTLDGALRLNQVTVRTGGTRCP
jgi:3D (Asp-Asp-Asp) domain-containing protein